jgi:hypothetical protein
MMMRKGSASAWIARQVSSSAAGWIDERPADSLAVSASSQSQFVIRKIHSVLTVRQVSRSHIQLWDAEEG